MGFVTILTTILGTAIGALKEIWLMNQRAKIEANRALMKKAGLITKDVRHARRQKGFQFARRLIVICFMIILLTPVYLIIQNPEITFYIPVQMKGGGFSFLFGLISGGGTEGVKYIGVQGYVYLLAIIDMIGFMVGFYFGSSGTQSRY